VLTGIAVGAVGSFVSGDICRIHGANANAAILAVLRYP